MSTTFFKYQIIRGSELSDAGLKEFYCIFQSVVYEIFINF